MKVKITVKPEFKEAVMKEFELLKVVPNQTFPAKEGISYICYIEPALYRNIDELVKKKLEGK